MSKGYRIASDHFKKSAAWLFAIIALSTASITLAENSGYNAAVVYQHCGFKGYGISLSEGNYSMRRLQRMGMQNDDLSSIRVKRGYVVTLFEHAGFRGRSLRLSHSDDCFVNNRFNDIVSSIKVRRLDRNRHGDHRPHGGRLHAVEQQKLARSISGKYATSINFVNRSRRTVKVFWLDYNANRKFYGVIQPGKTFGVKTFLTHPWLITDRNNNAINVYFPDSQPRRIKIR